jgi:H+/Cl- antiporter ClcA
MLDRPGMPPYVKLLFVGAAVLVLVGLVAWGFAAAKIPLGHLPGDLRVERPGFRLYVPLGTGLLLSLLLTAVFALWSWFRSR